MKNRKQSLKKKTSYNNKEPIKKKKEDEDGHKLLDTGDVIPLSHRYRHVDRKKKKSAGRVLAG